jgi:hypothetical protein
MGRAPFPVTPLEKLPGEWLEGFGGGGRGVRILVLPPEMGKSPEAERRGWMIPAFLFGASLLMIVLHFAGVL